MYRVGMAWWLATVIEIAQTASPARHAYSRAGDWQYKSTKARVLCGTMGKCTIKISRDQSQE